MSSLGVWKPRWFSLTITVLMRVSTAKKKNKTKKTKALFTSSARWIQKEIQLIGEAASLVTPPECNNGHVWRENLKVLNKGMH